MLTVKRVYNYYKYNTPIPVLSETETILFNIFNILLVSIGSYWLGRGVQLIPAIATMMH